MHPVAAGERVAELLKLSDGCNALLVDGAHCDPQTGWNAHAVSLVRCLRAASFNRTPTRYLFGPTDRIRISHSAQSRCVGSIASQGDRARAPAAAAAAEYA